MKMRPKPIAANKRGADGKDNAPTRQLLRYLLAGLCIYALDLLVFIVFSYPLQLHSQIANIAGRIAGAAAGFLLHKYWTFSWQQADRGVRQLFTYLALLLVNILASVAIFWLLSEHLFLAELPARLICDTVIILSSFIFSRLLVFRQDKEAVS